GLVGVRDAPFQFRELGCCKAHRTGECLAMDEPGLVRPDQALSLGRGYLDEIAEHAVMSDPKGSDPGFLGKARLQCGDDLPRFSRKPALLVEPGVESSADEAA